MMPTEIVTLCEDRVFRWFYEISQIPRGSGNEQAISDSLMSWARDLGLEAEQDEVMNVLIRKSASPGREDQPGIMLQAHMDMVCEKAEGVDHDFAKDPISWVVDGDFLSTGGRTTLGADDGIGIALALAMLEDDQLSHPPLEVLFTVMEEEDFTGAYSFDTSRMRSEYLINLDHTSEQDIICGSCGGMQVDFRMPLEFEPVPVGFSTYQLTVSGLRGGHSGEDIHRGRGNANALLARLIIAAEDCCDIRLAGISGGSFRLAIPREANALICLDPSGLPSLKEALHSLEEAFKAELPASAGQIAVTLESAKPAESCVAPLKVLDALTLLPDGIYQMNEVLTGLVDTSDNLGEVYLNPGELHCVMEIRSARSGLSDYLLHKIERLAALLGGTSEVSNVYPSWDFRPFSPLRQICTEVYEEVFRAKPQILTVHAGLEVGCFFARRSDLDAISIGPDCRDFHSPAESLRISSVKRIYWYLRRVLEYAGQTPTS